MIRTLLSWSSGKDSAWTLHQLRQSPEIELVGLLTTVNAEFNRVAMHGVRHDVLQAQARAAELPLWEVPLALAVFERKLREPDESRLRQGGC